MSSQFKIRPEQLRALEMSPRRVFEARMAAHLESFFEDQCARLGEGGQRSAIRYGLSRARRHGLTREREVCKYIDLMFTFGRDFDTRPDLDWVPEVLELNCRPSVKMKRLMDAALEVADLADGFDAEEADAPSEPAVRVRRRNFDPELSEEWVGTMSELVLHYCREEPYFRWDDARDLEGMEHLEAILEVVRGTPEVRHWLPTRAHDVLRTWLLTRPEELPGNLLVRLGALDPDTPAPDLAGMATATIHESATPMGEACPNAGDPGSCVVGGCAACRICWSAETRNVSFAPGRWPVRPERQAA